MKLKKVLTVLFAGAIVFGSAACGSQPQGCYGDCEDYYEDRYDDDDGLEDWGDD